MLEYFSQYDTILDGSDLVKSNCMAQLVDRVVEFYSHNYSLALASSVANNHFVVGVDFVEVLPKVVEVEVSGILVVDTDQKL